MLPLWIDIYIMYARTFYIIGGKKGDFTMYLFFDVN